MFSDLLWSMFPQAQRENWSEHRLAHAVAARLDVEGCPTHWRTVRNWLRCENSTDFHTFLIALRIARVDASAFDNRKDAA